jgi:hypothetical protein
VVATAGRKGRLICLSVENCPTFGAPAASLHIYSRPYAECDIYDLERGEKRRVVMAYDTMYGQPVS